MGWGATIWMGWGCWVSCWEGIVRLVWVLMVVWCNVYLVMCFVRGDGNDRGLCYLYLYLLSVVWEWEWKKFRWMAGEAGEFIGIWIYD